jgi:hypothetical protein
LAVADRAYGTLNGMAHCLNCGADYILRLRTNCFAVYDENGKWKTEIRLIVLADSRN